MKDCSRCGKAGNLVIMALKISKIITHWSSLSSLAIALNFMFSMHSFAKLVWDQTFLFCVIFGCQFAGKLFMFCFVN